MGGHNIFHRGPWLLCLESVVWWHFLTCSLSSAAMQGQKIWLHIRSSIFSRPKWPTSLWHPFRAVSQCMAYRTNCTRASWDSLGRVFLYRMPCLRLSWLHSWPNFQTMGRSIGVRGHWPRVPSCIFVITRPRTESACWAWCHPSVVMQANCGPSSTGSRIHRSQLYVSKGLMGPLRVASCTVHTAAVVTEWWLPRVSGTQLDQDTLDKASTSMFVLLYSTIGNCSWWGWPVSSDSLHPALPLLECTWGGCYWCRCERSIHRGIHGIPQPWPT